MTNLERIFVAEMLDESAWYELAEFCAALQAERHWVVELVEIGLLEPSGAEPDAWRFPARDLPRARATARLVNDLGVNLAGVAIILDLLEERRRLLARIGAMERAFGE
jgi:chaperone modulatory protein CbpM